MDQGCCFGELIVSIISAGIAIFAITRTNKAIKSQNSQALFERRLNCYVLCYRLYKLLDEHIKLLDHDKAEDGQPLEVVFVFGLLTNCVLLEKGARIITQLDNYEYKEIFLTDMEKLEAKSEECKLIYNEPAASYISEFIQKYKKFLINSYQYQILLDDMLKNNAVIHPQPKSFPDLQKEYGEQRIRLKLIKTEKELKRQYQKIKKEKVLEKLFEETKLR